MLTSKDLLDRAKISRATLNNYINQGLLPKPEVRAPQGGGTRARRIGYFPDSALDTIHKIEGLKGDGLRMNEIVDRMRGGGAKADAGPGGGTPPAPPARERPEEPAVESSEPSKAATWRPPDAVQDDYTPRLTPVAIMVAQLDQVDRVTAELPHDECFQLANQMWGTTTLIGRRYDAILAPYGRNSLVGYFLPNDERHYVMTAIRCARALQSAMRDIGAEWRNRKGWTNDLRLNVGIEEGHERFGAIRAGDRPIYAVFGESMDRAIALATMARGGALWVTKNTLGALDDEARKAIEFGIRHRDQNGQEFTVRGTYARMTDLLDAQGMSPEVGRAGAVTVAEVLHLADG